MFGGSKQDLKDLKQNKTATTWEYCKETVLQEMTRFGVRVKGMFRKVVKDNRDLTINSTMKESKQIRGKWEVNRPDLNKGVMGLRAFPGGWVIKNPPRQETGVWSLIREDLACFGAIKPECHNHWACLLEPGASAAGACRPQGLCCWEKPPQREASQHSWRQPLLTAREPAQLRAPHSRQIHRSVTSKLHVTNWPVKEAVSYDGSNFEEIYSQLGLFFQTAE